MNFGIDYNGADAGIYNRKDGIWVLRESVPTDASYNISFGERYGTSLLSIYKNSTNSYAKITAPHSAELVLSATNKP